MGFFEKLKQGLSKTRDDFNNKLSQVFSMGRKIDEEFYEELEETLIQADVGVQTGTGEGSVLSGQGSRIYQY